MTAADQSLDDAAERPVDTLDACALELAPDTVLQLLQLTVRLGHERLGRAAGRVVARPGRHERSSGVVELLPVRGVVLGLLLDARGLALQVIQQTWITVEVPFAVPVLCISHLVLLGCCPYIPPRASPRRYSSGEQARVCAAMHHRHLSHQDHGR
jgi:hypothetical protein